MPNYLQDISEKFGPNNTSNPLPPEVDVISKIGIALSLFGLVTTVITLLLIKWVTVIGLHACVVIFFVL